MRFTVLVFCKQTPLQLAATGTLKLVGEYRLRKNLAGHTRAMLIKQAKGSMRMSIPNDLSILTTVNYLYTYFCLKCHLQLRNAELAPCSFPTQEVRMIKAILYSEIIPGLEIVSMVIQHLRPLHVTLHHTSQIILPLYH